MKVSPSFHYTGKLWLITVLVSPVILFLSFAILSSASPRDMAETAILVLVMVLYGLVLSLPSLFLVWWIVNLIKEGQQPVWIKKTIIACIIAALILLSCICLDYRFFIPLSFQNIIWPGAYIFTLLIAIYSNKLPPPDQEIITG